MGISRSTKIANFNLGYLAVLGNAGTEYALYLTGAGCSASQIMNVASSTIPVCTENQLSNGTSTCKCCTLPDQVLMSDVGGLGKAKEICDALSDNLDQFIMGEYIKVLNGGTAPAALLARWSSRSVLDRAHASAAY